MDYWQNTARDELSHVANTCKRIAKYVALIVLSAGTLQQILLLLCFMKRSETGRGGWQGIIFSAFDGLARSCSTHTGYKTELTRCPLSSLKPGCRDASWRNPVQGHSGMKQKVGVTQLVGLPRVPDNRGREQRRSSSIVEPSETHRVLPGASSCPQPEPLSGDRKDGKGETGCSVMWGCLSHGLLRCQKQQSQGSTQLPTWLVW